MKKQLLAVMSIMLFMYVLAVPFVSAVLPSSEPSDEDKAKFDQILEPVLKVYNLVKYVASVLASLILLFAGITYIMSGSDPGKREKAKNMGMYAIIGLIVIWAAPLVVTLFVQ